MNFIYILEKLDSSDDLQLSRLLLLLSNFSTGKRSLGVDGLTKLAKLDFLLRYPVYLERAMKAKNLNPEKIGTKDFERFSVESSMIRFRYGPWDSRYKLLLNVLIGKGLVEKSSNGKKVMLKLTELGFQIAHQISETESFSEVVVRVKILKKHFNFSGNNLKKFIYDTFPEIVSLKWGEQIPV